MSDEQNIHLDAARFQRIAELQDAGQFAEVIRESQIALAETTDPNDQASLLIDAIVACQILDRVPEARQMLGKLKQLDISDVEGRLNAEFCEPCILVQEGRLEEGVVAFAALLERRGEILRQADFRYLYQDIQSRRALALVELERFGEALLVSRENISFVFESAEVEQRTRFCLAVSLEATGDSESAKEELIRVIDFGIKNDLEEHARYHLARRYFIAGAFARALQQLEAIVRDRPQGDFVIERRELYDGLSRTYQQVGDAANAKRYAQLAKKA